MPWEPDYVSAAEFKTFARIPTDDTQDDAAIDLAVTDGSRMVDQCVSIRPNGMGARRQFGTLAAPEARYYTPRWDQELARWVIEIDDLMDITGLVVKIDTNNDDVYESTVTNYVLRSKNALTRNRPYTQIAISNYSAVQPTTFVDSAQVTAKWGWTVVPTAVKQATMLTSHRIFKRRQAPFGITGAPSSGSEKRVIEKVDPDVAESLRPYIRLGWTV